MAILQNQFIGFHENIKLSDEDEILREKRDIIINRLKEKMPTEAKSYTHFNQGSYAMRTGIKPLDDQYDIDLGLSFDMSTCDAEPIEAKQWVLDALDGHTKNVKMKTPCVTVTYVAGYHVDVTVYAASNGDGKTYLAKGKPTSSPENKKWDESNPKDLIKTIRDKFTDVNDSRQFRRIIRYLKRWKDLNFSDTVYGKPTGIALTACAYHHMVIKKVCVDVFSNRYEYQDLDALHSLVKAILSCFEDVYVEENDEWVKHSKITVTLPVSPFSNLFEKMTNKQMDNFKEKLEKLSEALQKAEDEADPTDAATGLQKVLGEDFPVPPRNDTGKRASAPTVIPSSESA